VTGDQAVRVTDKTLHDGGAPSAGTSPELFRVVRGNPDAEEVAALAAVLTALSGGTPGGTDDSGTGPTGSRRDALRSQARRRHQLSGHPGAWRSGRF